MTAGERRLARPVATHALPAAAAMAARRPARRQGLRIGLLGGSFNPAHDGHRYVSLAALKHLDLDRIWWLVAPQNPLKSSKVTAPLALRLARARAVAAHPRVEVSDLEARIGSRYTVDTLAHLGHAFPEHRFVWLMGADNLLGLHRWRRWTAVVAAVPIAVFDREPYVYRALRGVAATRFAAARITGPALRDLASAEPPAWGIVRLRPHPASSSGIRAQRAWWQGGEAEEG